MKKVTLSDIEKETGYSKSTISRVLTGHGYVEAKTRDAIEAALARSGYARRVGKRVKADVSDLVMITSALLESPVHIMLARGASACLHKAGKKTAIMYNPFTSLNTEECLLYAEKNGFAGIIMLGALEAPSMLDVLKRIKLPIVLLNQNLRGLDVDTVELDDYKGAYMAMRRLLSLGHRRIAFLGGYANTTTVQGRERGYRDALKEQGLKVHKEDIFYGNFQEESGMEYARQLKRRRSDITALISCNDLMSIGFLQEAQAIKWRIPEDISLITFDNTYYTQNMHPRLTAVDYDFEAMGASAAELLLGRIKEPDAAVRRITYSPRLFEGESVSEFAQLRFGI